MVSESLTYLRKKNYLSWHFPTFLIIHTSHERKYLPGLMLELDPEVASLGGGAGQLFAGAGLGGGGGGLGGLDGLEDEPKFLIFEEILLSLLLLLLLLLLEVLLLGEA